MTGRLGRIALLVALVVLVPMSGARAECSPLDALVGCEEPPETPTPAPAPVPPPPPPPAPEPAPQPEPEPEPEPEPQPRPAPQAAARLVELMNEERAARDLPTLTVDRDVEDIAEPHSQAMAEANDIWHNDAYFSAATKDRLGAVSVGENVAMNADVDDAHRRLMASPGHRANILNASFTVVGVGVSRQADGTYFVTEDFLQPRAQTAAPTQPPPQAQVQAPAETPRSAAAVDDDPAPQASEEPRSTRTVELAAPTDLSAAEVGLGRWPSGRTSTHDTPEGSASTLPLWPLPLAMVIAVGAATSKTACRTRPRRCKNVEWTSRSPSST